MANLLKSYSPSEIHLDINNPRLKGLPDQRACFEELLRPVYHTKALAEDIARDGWHVDEVPALYAGEDGVLRVKDGNRRMLCAKLLQNPDAAPSTEFRDYFVGLKKRMTQEAANTLVQISCRLCTTEKEAYELMMRRHSGMRQGAGQVRWSRMQIQNAKEYGKKFQKGDSPEQGDSLAAHELVKKFVAAHPDHAGWETKFPVSTLERIMPELCEHKNAPSQSALSARYDAVRDEKITAVIKGLGEKKFKVDDVKTREKAKTYLSKEYGISKGTGVIVPEKKAVRGAGRVIPAGSPKSVRKMLGELDPRGSRTSKAESVRQELLRVDHESTPLAWCILFRTMVDLATREYCAVKGFKFHLPDPSDQKQRDPSVQFYVRKVLDEAKRDPALKRQMEQEASVALLGPGPLAIEYLHRLVHSDGLVPDPTAIAPALTSAMPYLRFIFS